MNTTVKRYGIWVQCEGESGFWCKDADGVTFAVTKDDAEERTKSLSNGSFECTDSARWRYEARPLPLLEGLPAEEPSGPSNEGGAEALEQATDRLNELFIEAEDYFIGLGGGIRVQVLLDKVADQEEVWLCLMKQKGTFGLYVVTSGQTSPLVSASRRHRILAVSKLEELRLAVVEETSRSLLEIVGAADDAREFLKRVKAV